MNFSKQPTSNRMVVLMEQVVVSLRCTRVYRLRNQGGNKQRSKLRDRASVGVGGHSSNGMRCRKAQNDGVASDESDSRPGMTERIWRTCLPRLVEVL